MDEAKKRLPVLWIIVAVAAVLVIAALVYESVVSNEFKKTLPQESGPVVFSETGQAETFTLKDSVLNAISPEKVGDYTVRESAADPSGKEVVLADKADAAGTVLGIIDGGAVTTVLSDGTPKTDLHIASNGIAVYAVYARGIVWAASVPQITPDLTAPAPGDVEGHATGPVDTGVTFATPPDAPAPASSGPVELFAIDLVHGGQPHSLGLGKNPRIRADGSLVALTPDGVAVIDLQTGKHTVIVPRMHGDGLGSTLSADGAVALFRAEGSNVADVYAVGEKDGQYAGTIVSRGNVFGAAFSGESHIFIRTALNRAELFALRQGVTSGQPPVSSLPIVNAQ